MKKERKTTQQLFNDLTARLIIPLENNEMVCPTCKGLRFIYKQKNDTEGSIVTCTDCYNGKLYVCKYCGKTSKTNYCDCKEAEQQRVNKFNKEQQEKELELFEKAKKIKFDDYKGYFIFSRDILIQDREAVYDWMYNKIKYEKLSDNELPKYLWGTVAESVFNLNLEDIISDKCENGYEDMYSCLDTNDEDLHKAQEYLDKWYKKQGNSVNIYYEDHNVAVLLDDLIKEIREDVKEGDE